MQHKIFSEQLEVLINNSGAEICSIRNKQNTELLWQADKAVWARHAPVLFPIVGRLKNNTYTFDNSAFEMLQHGFARDHAFLITEKSDASCTFELRATDATKKSYPFDFIFSISYVLSGSSISCTYKIINPGDKELYFSVGAHPGFNCPTREGEKFSDYYLEFEKNNYTISTLSEGLRLSTRALTLNDNRLYLSEDLFDNDALVFENNQINKVRLCSSVSDYAIEITCAGWPYFGIWAKKRTAQFICLEPWYGITDYANTSGELVEKHGIIALLPKQDFSCSFSINVG